MSHPVQQLKNLFPAHLHSRLFMVGGMVRDLLLGVESQDIDLTGALSHEEFLSLRFRLVRSKSTPEIYFLYHKELGKIEVIPLPDPSALPDDLGRRDFTINAIAQSLDGTIVDPLGGRSDLAAGLLRPCSPRSLADDPGRIFRAFRFECEGWRFAPELEEMLRSRDWAPELARLPVERFSQEMLKALGKKDPALFFRRLVSSGTGKPFLPQLARMPEIPAGPLEHHPEGDLFTHSLQVLEKVAQRTPDPIARFCGFFHDLGKLETEPELYPKHHGHEEAGAVAARLLGPRLRLPAAMQRALEAVCRLHGTANRWQELRDGKKVRLALNAWKGGVAEILPLVVAADAGEALERWQDALRVVQLSTVELGLEPGYFETAEVAPEKRQDLILQRMIEAFRAGNEPPSSTCP